MQILLGNRSKNCSASYHVFFKETILQSIEKEVLLIAVRPDGCNTAPDYNLAECDVNSPRQVLAH